MIIEIEASVMMDYYHCYQIMFKKKQRLLKKLESSNGQHRYSPQLNNYDKIRDNFLKMHKSLRDAGLITATGRALSIAMRIQE